MKSPYLRADKILNDLIKEARRLKEVYEHDKSLCDELDRLANDMHHFMKTADLRSASKETATELGYYVIRMEEIYERCQRTTQVS